MGLVGEYDGDTLGDGGKNGDIGGPGELGEEPGCAGDQLGDIPEASEAADGEKLGPPGVIPLTANENKK